MNRILIESQWNLKSIQYLCDYYGADILIESQWNLKFFSFYAATSALYYINRITVEFKSKTWKPEELQSSTY